VSATTTTSHWVAAREALGARVVDLAGEKLGTLEDLAIDPRGQVTFAIVAFGGLLGLGEKLFVVPWTLLQWREGDRSFALQHHGKRREDLVHAPHVTKHPGTRWDPSSLDRLVGPAVHSFYPGH
jgi:hypothetical protein